MPSPKSGVPPYDTAMDEPGGDFPQDDLDDIDESDLVDTAKAPATARRPAADESGDSHPWDDDDEDDDESPPPTELGALDLLQQNINPQKKKVSQYESVGIMFVCVPRDNRGQTIPKAENVRLFGDKTESQIRKELDRLHTYRSWQIHKVEERPGKVDVKSGNVMSRARPLGLYNIDLDDRWGSSREDEDTTMPDENDFDDAGFEDIDDDETSDFDTSGLRGDKASNGNGNGGDSRYMMVALDRMSRNQREGQREMMSLVREMMTNGRERSHHGDRSTIDRAKEIAELVTVVSAAIAPVIEFMRPRDMGADMIALITKGMELKDKAERPSLFGNAIQGAVGAATIIASLKNPDLIGSLSKLIPEVTGGEAAPAAQQPAAALPTEEPPRRIATTAAPASDRPPMMTPDAFREVLWSSIGDHAGAVARDEIGDSVLSPEHWASRVFHEQSKRPEIIADLLSRDTETFVDDGMKTESLTHILLANAAGATDDEKRAEVRQTIRTWSTAFRTTLKTLTDKATESVQV